MPPPDILFDVDLFPAHRRLRVRAADVIEAAHAAAAVVPANHATVHRRLPNFYHRGWDQRAQREIADYDLVVFGPRADPDRVSPYAYDDSNEPDDPAAQERKT